LGNPLTKVKGFSPTFSLSLSPPKTQPGARIRQLDEFGRSSGRPTDVSVLAAPALVGHGDT